MVSEKQLARDGPLLGLAGTHAPRMRGDGYDRAGDGYDRADRSQNPGRFMHVLVHPALFKCMEVCICPTHMGIDGGGTMDVQTTYTTLGVCPVFAEFMNLHISKPWCPKQRHHRDQRPSLEVTMPSAIDNSALLFSILKTVDVSNVSFSFPLRLAFRHRQKLTIAAGFL